MKVRALVDTNVEVPGWLRWRIIDPYNKCKSQGYDFDTIPARAFVKLDPDIDILVLPRIIVPFHERQKTSEWLQSIRKQGTILVYEADDDIWSPDYVSQISKLFTINDSVDSLNVAIMILEEKTNDALWTLQQCDYATATTRLLAEYMEQVSGIETHVIPNALNISQFTSALADKSGPFTVGWAGGRRNEQDLIQMIRAWELLAQRYSNIHFVIGGWLPKCVSSSKLLEGRYTFHSWKSFETYASSMQVDVGCCSVSDNPFARRKSPIKAWEYIMAGATVVASRTLYGDEYIALLCDSTEEWFETISALIQFPEARKVMNDVAQKHVKAYHDLQFQYRIWVETYECLIDANNKVVV